MKKLTGSFLYILASALLSSCYFYQPGTVVGTGDVISTEVGVPDFSGVNITGTCDVDIRTGETQQVILRAQSQVLDVMTCEVAGGILEIGFDHGVNVETREEISAEITVRSLNFIGITGAANYIARGERQPYLDIYITGTGDVNTLDLPVNECSIIINGAGNCEVHADSSLEVDISGVGNVFYTGHPALSTDISGVGMVTALEN
jgi:hypothetical protein